MLRPWGRLCCYALCALAMSCVQRRSSLVPPAGATGTGAVNLASQRSATSSGHVEAQLLGCDVVAPVMVEDASDDGRLQPLGTDLAEIGSTDPSAKTISPRIRLDILLTNLTLDQLLVATCHGGLTIIHSDGPTNLCPLGASAWTWLPPQASLRIYPTVPAPPTFGTHTDRLLPDLGHAPDWSWIAYYPNAVSFRLTPTGCDTL